MTEVYFVRHSKVDYIVSDSNRQLSFQGIKDIEKVNTFFEKVHIDAIISSPYTRAIDTISDLAKARHLDIHIIDDLRERKVSDEFIEHFDTFCINQWKDHDFKLKNGESLNEVRHRGIPVINKLLKLYHNKSIVIGTHGTFLSVYLNSLDAHFGYDDFLKLKMPDIVKVTYNNQRHLEILHMNL